MRTITLTQARKLALSVQCLDKTVIPANSAGIAKIFRDLGCIQIDPIRAVERTQQVVLWSRLGNYDRAELATLQWTERTLFEYWAHAASIVRTENYPIHQVQMRRYIDERPQVQEWIEANHVMRDYVFDRLQHDGALSTGDFEDRTVVPWKSTGWNHNRNVGMMLSFLWTRGDLMVVGREGTKRFWGRTVDHLPAVETMARLNDEEMVYQAAQHSLRALGVATQKQIANHFVRGQYPGLTNIMTRLQSAGQIEQVAIAAPAKKAENSLGFDQQKQPWYIHSDTLALLDRIERDEWQGRTTLLSPFDNLICDRARTEQLFGFDYKIEIYVPKAKRQYGYYVLPILHQDRLIGRIDSKMDRKKGCYVVSNVYAETGAPLSKRVGRSITRAITDLATFLGATEVVYGKNGPKEWAIG